MQHFDIERNDPNVSIEEIKAAVENEMKGPGQLLGYRALHLKIRQEYGLKVKRDLVYAAMVDIDYDSVKSRQPRKKQKKQKQEFKSCGPNWLFSLDGHDKLMGYQNDTFPIAIYGCIDTASRKIMWLKAWESNSKPELIGRWYFDYLYETRTLPNRIRLDKGTETGVMATMHSFLRSVQEDMTGNDENNACDKVLFGPSTSNKIERWWKELHERLEMFYKSGLRNLVDTGHYDRTNDLHRKMLSFVMVPVIQREIDIFKDKVWNVHRVRSQKDVALPAGVPNHIYDFPEEYNLEPDRGFQVNDEQLREVADYSGILDHGNDFLDNDMRVQFEQIIPYPENIKNQDCFTKYLYLKNNL
ncbi:uncharacterized protein [Clytia hemisphaerica]|uniref:uncharacterized protein n=1 Tax=Clytia hemisphaerica TaxID=252671 RepID=UPI0034D4E071